MQMQMATFKGLAGFDYRSAFPSYNLRAIHVRESSGEFTVKGAAADIDKFIVDFTIEPTKRQAVSS